MTRNDVPYLRLQGAGAQSDEISGPSPPGPAVQVRYPSGTTEQMYKDAVINFQVAERLLHEMTRMFKAGAPDRQTRIVHRKLLEGLNQCLIPPKRV